MGEGEEGSTSQRSAQVPRIDPELDRVRCSLQHGDVAGLSRLRNKAYGVAQKLRPLGGRGEGSQGVLPET